MSRMSARAPVASIQYEDLEIEVARCMCGQREVRVLSSQFDRPRERFQPTYDVADLDRRLEELDEIFLDAADGDATVRRSKLAESIGLDLYRALFPGRLQKTLSSSLARLHTLRETRAAGLRIRLSFGDLGADGSGVVGLPWELLCFPDTRGFPSSAPETPVVRYLDLDRPAAALAVKPPLRILAVLASPKGLPAIDRAHHEAMLRDACANDGRLKLINLESPTLKALRAQLRHNRDHGKPIHAIHFLGHGAFEDDGTGFVHFEDAVGNSARVSGQVLAQQLQGFNELRLAVLSTCVGGRLARYRGQHPFTGSASALVAGGLSAVVAMQFPVSEKAAANFTSSFYGHLAAGHPLEEAVTEGRLRILSEDVGTVEWASPVLFLRARDGRLFRLEHPSDEEKERGSGGDTIQEANNTGSGNVTQVGVVGRDANLFFDRARRPKRRGRTS